MDGDETPTLILDHMGRLLSRNPAAADLFAQHTPIHQQLPIFEALRALEESTTSRIPVHLLVEGAPVPFEMQAHHAEDSSGQQRLVIRLHDQSMMQSLQKQLEESSRLSTAASLLLGVAHDLRSLLSVSHLQLESLDLIDDEVERAQTLTEIREVTRQAAFILRHSLSYSQQPSELLHHQSISTTIQRALHIVRACLRSNIQLKVAPTALLDQVQMPPLDLERVMLNLILNAQESMSSGGTIHIHASNLELLHAHHDVPAGRYVRIAITDEGHGMADELLEQITEPLFSTHNSSGLGLLVVTDLIARSHGFLSFDSTPDVGTTVEVLLPAAS